VIGYLRGCLTHITAGPRYARALNAPSPRSRAVKGHAGGKCRHYQSDAAHVENTERTDAAAVSEDQRMTGVKANAEGTRDIGVVRKPLIQESIADHERRTLEYGVTAKRFVTKDLAKLQPAA